MSTARGRNPASATAIRAVAPNPSGGSSEIAFDVADTGPVTLAVYDALGREVARVVDEVREAGTHRVRLDVRSLPAGVYVVRMTAGGTVQSRDLTVVR